jgi:acetyl-CoA carboxylase biotin carboxyl carrier protein
MSLDEIKQLIAVLQETGVAELEVQRGENRVKIRAAFAAEAATAGAPIATYVAAAPNASGGAQPAETNSSSAAAPAAPVGELITSPMVGTFYEAAQPGTPPFVKVGDRVEKGQVVCIVESMKLMNEIESEFSGTITEKLIENGKPVEFGKPLFRVQA